jgi:hypothetical protein
MAGRRSAFSSPSPFISTRVWLYRRVSEFQVAETQVVISLQLDASSPLQFKRFKVDQSHEPASVIADGLRISRPWKQPICLSDQPPPCGMSMGVGSPFKAKAACDAVSVATEPFAELSRVDDAIFAGEAPSGLRP